MLNVNVKKRKRCKQYDTKRLLNKLNKKVYLSFDFLIQSNTLKNFLSSPTNFLFRVLALWS